MKKKIQKKQNKNIDIHLANQECKYQYDGGDQSRLVFLFTKFEHKHELFNLGDTKSGKITMGSWFISLFDSFKEMSNMTISELQKSSFQLHRVNWDTANTPRPKDVCDEDEFWQIRINKSRGRIIGTLIYNRFDVRWLDPHHNLTNSIGYGGVQYFSPGKTEYELLQEENTKLRKKIKELEELLDNVCS